MIIKTKEARELMKKWTMEDGAEKTYRLPPDGRIRMRVGTILVQLIKKIDKDNYKYGAMSTITTTIEEQNYFINTF